MSTSAASKIFGRILANRSSSSVVSRLKSGLKSRLDDIYDMAHRRRIEKMVSDFDAGWDRDSKVGPLRAWWWAKKQSWRDGSDIKIEWQPSNIRNAYWDPSSKKVILLYSDRFGGLGKKIPGSILKHELGHAHKSITPTRLMLNQIDGTVMPFRRLKNNKVYKEEVRAWDNAERLHGRIDKNLRDAALATYEYDADRKRAKGIVGYGALAVGALVVGRILYKRHRQKVQQREMAKAMMEAYQAGINEAGNEKDQIVPENQ